MLVWAETGLGGIVAFLWFMGATIRRGWVCWQVQDPIIAPLGLACAAAICGHMIHMQFDTFQNRPLIQTLWMSSALIIAMHNILHREQLAARNPNRNKEVQHNPA